MILQTLFLLWFFSLFGAIPGIFIAMLVWVDLMRNDSTIDLLGFPIDNLFYKEWAKSPYVRKLPKALRVIAGVILLLTNTLMWTLLSFCGVIFSAYLIGRLVLLYVVDSVGIPLKICEDRDFCH